MSRIAWSCVHDHLTGAVACAMAMSGAVRASDGSHLAWVPSSVLPPGYVHPRNGVGGWCPDDGSVYQFDSSGAGCRSRRRGTCPHPTCQAEESRSALGSSLRDALVRAGLLEEQS